MTELGAWGSVGRARAGLRMGVLQEGPSTGAATGVAASST